MPDMERKDLSSEHSNGDRTIGDFMIKMKKSGFVSTIIATVVATLLIGGVIGYVVMGALGLTVVNKNEYDKYEDIASRYAKLYQLQSVINREFLWETDENAQMDVMYKSLVDSLDDKYSEYYTAEEYEKFLNYIQGTFTGVGIVFMQSEDNNKEFVIMQVIEDGPADSVGIKVGDIITHVNGKQYDDMNKVAEHLRGETGTKVEVTYRRETKTDTVEIVRGTVEEPSVGATILDGKYGYIRIAAFEQGTGKQFETELAKMENMDLKGLVIDLRMNPGGLLDSGIEIADALLPEGIITQTVDNKGKKQKYNSDAECTRMKYVVLVDDQSASTSEVVAAAIKDNNGGLIVGTRTFGKGIIQSVEQFPDGSAIKLTTMEYLSPKGNHIHKKGISPDYTVKLNENTMVDTQLEKALSLLK